MFLLKIYHKETNPHPIKKTTYKDNMQNTSIHRNLKIFQPSKSELTFQIFLCLVIRFILGVENIFKHYLILQLGTIRCISIINPQRFQIIFLHCRHIMLMVFIMYHDHSLEDRGFVSNDKWFLFVSTQY